MAGMEQTESGSPPADAAASAADEGAPASDPNQRAASPPRSRSRPAVGMDTGQMDAIVVTARRRDELLKDVPGAVTAISSDVLERLEVTELGDIQSLVPNLVLHEGDAQNAVAYIRGVGQIDSLSFADPGIGIYIDDVYLGRTQGAFLDIIDAERIEVLRGPQGTLYGRNTIGGAIKFVSRKGTDEPQASASLTVGNYGREEVKFSVSGALAPDVYGSFTAASLEHGGYANNDARGKSDGDRDTVAWRASLVRSWDSGLSVALAMDLSEDRPETSRTPVLATSSDVAPGEPTPKSADPFRVNADFNGLNKLAVSGASAHVSLPVNDEISLKSITSYRGLKYQSHLDLDATDRGTFGVFVDQTQSQYSQELQMNYEGGPYKIVLGYYVLRENDENENGIYAPEYTLNGAAATAFNLPDGTPFPYSTNSLNDQVTSSEAFYVDVAIELYEKVNMSIGMRRTDETKVLKRAYRELFQSQPPYKASVMIGGRGNNFDAGMTRSYSDFSPRLTVDYEFSDTVNGYVSYSQGFKAGGFDGRADTVAEIRPYRPEKLSAREVGLKGSADGEVPVVFNIALFSNDYRDLQVSSFGANSTGGFQAVFSNAARASFTGLEIEFTAHLSDDLRLDMMLGTLNASYGSFIQDGENLAQRLTPVNAPSRVARVAAQYERSFGSGLDAVFSLGLNHRGEVYPTVSSSEAVHQSAYTLIDMAATLKMNEGRREVKFVGRNLRDKAYINHAFDLSANPGYQLAYYGAPMNYSFSYIVRM